MIKTIFFDVYQTLLSVDDSGNDMAWQVFSDYLKKQGIQISNLEFKKLVSLENQKYYKSVNDPEMKTRHHNLANSINTVFLNHHVKVENDGLLNLIWEFRKKYVTDLQLYVGVENMLRELSKKYVLSTASYTQGSYTHKELETLKIAKYFSHFIFSSDIGYRKTDCEFFKVCLKKTNSSDMECVMVGDNYLQDVVSPKKVGLKAILIENPQTKDKNDIKEIQSDNTIKVEEIMKLPVIIESL